MEVWMMLVIAGAALIIAELVLGVDTGFDFLLIGLSLVLGGTASYYFGTWWGVISAAALAFGYVFLARKALKNKLQAFSHHSNVDSLLGHTIQIKSWNSEKNVGSATVNGEDWRLVSKTHTSFEPNQAVKILDIEGVSLVIAPLEKE